MFHYPSSTRSSKNAQLLVNQIFQLHVILMDFVPEQFSSKWKELDKALTTTIIHTKQANKGAEVALCCMTAHHHDCFLLLSPTLDGVCPQISQQFTCAVLERFGGPLELGQEASVVMGQHFSCFVFILAFLGLLSSLWLELSPCTFQPAQCHLIIHFWSTTPGSTRPDC